MIEFDSPSEGIDHPCFGPNVRDEVARPSNDNGLSSETRARVEELSTDYEINMDYMKTYTNKDKTDVEKVPDVIGMLLYMCLSGMLCLGAGPGV
eukprot:6840163-Alexandrium_andersonii.AAC.1